MKSKIEVRQSGIKGAGRGIFATTNIKKGETIEICPILILPGKDYKHIEQTMLMRYIFDYSGDSTMFALGFGSLYNHHNVPNAKYELLEYTDLTEQDSELYIIALRPISKNEEIYINYGEAFDEMYKAGS